VSAVDSTTCEMIRTCTCICCCVTCGRLLIDITAAVIAGKAGLCDTLDQLLAVTAVRQSGMACVMVAKE
jgi:hypothetical protein